MEQLPSINKEVDSIIQKIFGVNEDVNLKFSVANALGGNSLIDGYNKGNNYSSFGFNGFIKLNWVLDNATQEYILVTLLHESIHAYIDYWRSELALNKIDSVEFKKRFPIYWDYKRKLTDNELMEHNEMANNYISTMKNAIKSYNPNATDAAAEALAWGGLQDATIWKSKSDTNAIIQINLNSRDINLNKFSQYNFQKCPGMLPQ